MRDSGVGEQREDQREGATLPQPDRAPRGGAVAARPARAGGALLAFLLASALVGIPARVQAQIWVVKQPDGGRRFTTQPEPGAELFLRTPHSSRPAGAAAEAAARYEPLIVEAAARHGLDPALLRAVIATESNFDARARSERGAQGLMQLMPETARELGVRDVWDPHANVEGGAAYLAELLRRYSDLRLALAAYNAGPGAVDKYGGIPPFSETRQYVERVLSSYHNLR